MKIPDKVYIPYEIGPDYISDHYYLGPTPKMENAEYIHKDVLMEWAKKKNKRIDTEDGDYSLGYVSAMIDLIDKIESL